MLRHTVFFFFHLLFSSSSSLQHHHHIEKFITKNTKLLSLSIARPVWLQLQPRLCDVTHVAQVVFTLNTSSLSSLFFHCVFFFFFYFIFRVCHKSHTFHLISHTHLRRKLFFCRFSFDFGKVITDILYLYTIEVVFSLSTRWQHLLFSFLSLF